MRLQVLLPMLSVALLGFAPAPFQKAERCRLTQALTDVAGTWQILSWEFRGKPTPGVERVLEIRMTRERLAFIDKKAGAQDKFVMKLDPAASPPAFSLSVGKQVEMVGSYRLRRDDLIMIFDEGESLHRRPTDFSGKVAYRVELRRIRRD